MTLLAGVVLLAAVAMSVGAMRWRAGTKAIRARLEAARLAAPAARFERSELDSLPEVVRRYFLAVMEVGQPIVASVHLEHAGTFNLSESGEQWKPFTSDQRVVTRRPGFDWDGRIAMAPGIAVRVHDAYVAGEGLLHASLLGLLPMADLRGTRELAEGELLRFLAEAVWYPTALLPGQGVQWTAVDERSALATLRDGERSVSLRFHFGADDLIDTVSPLARGPTVQGVSTPTPWQGRFWNYALRGGMRIPLDGEVAWLMPTGPQTYWRGRITRIEHHLLP